MNGLLKWMQIGQNKWRKRMVDFIKWIATLVTLGGALATTLALDPLNIYLLNFGAVLFLVWGMSALLLKRSTLL